ncbi:TPA: replication protein [Streptococcus equi subsp. zooepidemicus]|nr:replication protein [Streptococcus equi subsp. zooepidemicus]HEL1342982.1 replication protein [Streptococcus equi subsp. zooepidemicus]
MVDKKELARNWSWIVYPDSAPENWRKLLDEMGEKWIESPLHDKDVNETTSEIKKAHWHIIISFKNKKSYKQMLEISDLLHAPNPEKVGSLQGAVQYLWHRNNPEKYQYDKSEVVAHNGFKYRQYLTDIGIDTDVILQEVVSWISETGCSEYADLVDYAVAEKFDDWFPTVRSQTIFLTAYLRSNRHKPRSYDSETGEILDES